MQTPGNIFNDINAMPHPHRARPKGGPAPKGSSQPLEASPQAKLLNLIASHFPHLLKIKRDADSTGNLEAGGRLVVNARVHARGPPPPAADCSEAGRYFEVWGAFELESQHLQGSLPASLCN